MLHIHTTSYTNKPPTPGGKGERMPSTYSDAVTLATSMQETLSNGIIGWNWPDWTG